MCTACECDSRDWYLMHPSWWFYQARQDTDQPCSIKAGQWALTQSGDPLTVWDDAPEPEPPESDAAAWDAWVSKVQRFANKLLLPPDEGHDLVEAARAAGWNRENAPLSWWLFEMMAKSVAADPTGRAADSGHRYDRSGERNADERK